MNRIGASLEPANVQPAMFEVDRVPARRDELTRPQAVTKCHQDHGSVTMPVPIGRRCFYEPFDLVIGQILAVADLGIGSTGWWAMGDCPIFSGWCWGCQV